MARRLSSLPFAVAVLAVAGLAGCGSLPGFERAPALPAGLRNGAELKDVPFYPQEEYQCGPAALATVLSYAGVVRSPRDLVDQVYLPQRNGSLQAEMMAATRRAGLLAYRLQPDLGAVLQEVAAGHPVIVLQNLRFEYLPVWHYAVVIGFDQPSQQVMLRSGPQMRLVEAMRDFERSWARAGRWSFVAVPPGTVPVTAIEDDFVLAVSDLERVSPPAAREAYRAALARWPGDLVARIGLGNIAYGQHRLPEAEVEYRHATRDHPDSGDAWNNLAQVLHELKRDREAVQAARRAVAIGGRHQQVYRSTLDAIEPARAP